MKKRHYNDLEPRMSYLSRKNRTRRTVLKWSVIVMALIVLAIFLTLRFGLMVKCASANGFYESDRCNGAQCCETVTFNSHGKPVIN